MPSLRIPAAAAWIVVLSQGLWAADVRLSYAVDLTSPQTGMASVVLTARNVSGQGFELRRESAAGTAWFDALRACDGSGRQLEAVTSGSGWYITSNGADTVTVEYSVRPGEVRQGGHIGIITAGYAALDGSMLFLVPEDKVPVGSVELAVKPPADWKIITAWPQSGGVFHPDAEVAAVRVQLANSLLCAGPFERVTRRFGLNEVNVWTLADYPGPEAAALAEVLFRIYGAVHGILSCDTGVQYNVVCLPSSPDGLPSGAGAWVDGQALTLAGKFPNIQSLRYAQLYAKFMAQGYFAGKPFGVKLSEQDAWLEPAVWRYCEMVAGTVTGKLDQDSFYSDLYEVYASQAARDVSDVDVPLAGIARAAGAQLDFLSEVKAPLLLMRLDFEIRAVTNNERNIDDFLRFLCNKSRGGNEVGVFPTLGEFLGSDASDLEAKLVLGREVILPTWPAFLDKLASDAVKPGEIVATVDGAPIYQKEVDIMVDALLAQGTRADRTDVERLALAGLVNEKVMDKTLAEYRMNVIPEAFWRLRLALPGPVASMIVAMKRQAVKDLLYNDWLQTARGEAKVEYTKGTSDGRAPAAGH